MVKKALSYEELTTLHEHQLKQVSRTFAKIRKLDRKLLKCNKKKERLLKKRQKANLISSHEYNKPNPFPVKK